MTKGYSNLLEIEFVPLSEAKAKLSEFIRRISRGSRRVAVTTNGKPTAVLLSYSEFLDLIRQIPGKTQSSETRSDIDLSQWRRQKSKRRQLSQYINSLFNPRGLSRKGQKSYKQEKVREFSK